MWSPVLFRHGRPGTRLIQGKDLSKMAIERLAGYCLGLLPILDGRPFFDSGSETWFYLTAPDRTYRICIGVQIVYLQ